MSIKHAILTGGSSGIGKAVAIQLARQGYNITIIARSKRTLKQAAEDIAIESKHGKEGVLVISCDVSDREKLQHCIENAVEHYGTPDVLLTSAGIAHPDYFDNLEADVFKKTMDINYLGTLYAIKSVFPYMKEKATGHIITVSSGAGLVGLFGYSAYSPSKFAIRGLAEALRPEFKRFGVHISVVYPPDTDTNQLHQENLTKPKETKQITGVIKPWSAEDVATCIVKSLTKKKFNITPGLSVRLLRLLHSPLFSLLNFHVDRVIAKNK